MYCIKYNKYRRLKNPKIYTFGKTFVISIICDDKCGSTDEKYLKKNRL